MDTNIDRDGYTYLLNLSGYAISWYNTVYINLCTVRKDWAERAPKVSGKSEVCSRAMFTVLNGKLIASQWLVRTSW